jgi:hypothetical protein
MSEFAWPVEPACYGNDQTFGWFWRTNFNRIMKQAQEMERDRDRWRKLAESFNECPDGCEDCKNDYEEVSNGQV